jgi:hypothetical protein
MPTLRSAAATLCVAVFILASQPAFRAEEVTDPRERVQRVVDESRARLEIPQEVSVSIVPSNILVVSVQPKDGAFVLAVEEGFLRELSDDDLRAVVAHELGHVWIFTHHPYLQTEQLANQIAMRLVARETLEPIYDKLWKRLGVTGDMAAYLGTRTASLH